MLVSRKPMIWSDDSKLALQRQRQHAKFQRWFGRGSFGQFYIDRNGKSRRIDPARAEEWIDHAMTISDAYFEKANRHTMIVGGASVFVLMILFRFIPFIHTHFTACLVGVGVFHLHYLIWQYNEHYRRPLKTLRDHIERSLAAATPYPEEIVASYRRRNPWQIPLIILAWAILITIEMALEGWIIDSGTLWVILFITVFALCIMGLLAMRKDEALLNERASTYKQKRN